MIGNSTIPQDEELLPWELKNYRRKCEGYEIQYSVYDTKSNKYIEGLTNLTMNCSGNYPAYFKI